MGTMTVTIPAKTEHEGLFSAQVTISDKCPVCGGDRGKKFSGVSFDGSHRLDVDQWNNPCGHVDKYSAVRKEAGENGLNTQ